jgi:hypothetical protein
MKNFMAAYGDDRFPDLFGPIALDRQESDAVIDRLRSINLPSGPVPDR